MHTHAVSLLALMSAVSAATAAPPATSQPPPSGNTGSEVEQLRAVVKDLQSEVDALKAQSNDSWLTQKRADEIRGLVQDVLADADTRASLLQSGAVAGYDKGFFISSADGNYLLRIGGLMQVRYVYNVQDEDSGNDPDRSGFEMRRMKLILKGNVFDPSWSYVVEFGADRSTGNLQLDDYAYAQKDFGNGLKVRGGQMKAPFLREEMLSSSKLFAVERSLVNSFFTAGVVQGVMLNYEADRWRLYAMLHDGNNSKNTAWSVEDTEFAASARAEFLLMGEKWADNDNYTGFRGGPGGLVLGAAVNYSKQEFGTGSNLPPPDFNNNETSNLGFTVDATYVANGWSLAGAGFYRSLDPHTGATLDQTGLMVRGGFFVADTWELYAQYEWADAEISGVPDLSVITFGVNKYFDKHNLKWQTDVGFGLNEVNAIFAQDSAGYRADPNGSDGQIVLRTQFQLLF